LRSTQRARHQDSLCPSFSVRCAAGALARGSSAECGSCGGCPRTNTPLSTCQQGQQQPHASSSSSSSASVATCTLVSHMPHQQRLTQTRLTCTRARALCCAVLCCAGVPAGEGTLQHEDNFRLRLACAADIRGSASTLRTAPRPPAFPGTQMVSLQDAEYRGKVYPDSVLAEDVAVFVSPGDVEDAAYSAGACLFGPQLTDVHSSGSSRSSSSPARPCRGFAVVRHLARQAYAATACGEGGSMFTSAAHSLTAAWSAAAQSCCLQCHKAGARVCAAGWQYEVDACVCCLQCHKAGARVCWVCCPACRIQRPADQHNSPVRDIRPSWLQRAVHNRDSGCHACCAGGRQQPQQEPAAGCDGRAGGGGACRYVHSWALKWDATLEVLAIPGASHVLGPRYMRSVVLVVLG
jgi:hypothetical protein